jgi:carboxypeptidase family protein/TonB-dependent receptor-like protein
MRTLYTLGAISLIALAPLPAQTNPTPASAAGPRTGRAQIIGVVIDSLNGGFLSGASILIDGMSASAETDSLGRFSFDSLPPGNFQLGVFHPRLDTLSLSIVTKPFHVGPDSTSGVIIAVPSAATIVRDRCPNAMGAAGKSALIGEVKDPETLRPVAGAEVSIAWSELEISKEVGIRRTPHTVRDTTDKTGAYHLCGLPNSMAGTLQARHGAAATAEIPVSLGDRPIELVARSILLAAADSATTTGNATVSGVVTLEGGAPGAGSRVELLGTPVIALTDAKGEFTMRNLPSGSRVLLARHLGYAAQTAPVDLSSHEQQHVTIKLPRFVAVMDPVLVTARRVSALDKVGFGQRRKSGTGYYIGPERLGRMHAFSISDVLRMVPGLRTVRTASGNEGVVSSRGFGNSCVEYYVDDVPFLEMEPGDINSFVNGGEVVAVEVYQSGLAPPQYARNAGSCTSIVLWTKFKIGS